ncbi:hypothetical protein [Methylobacterium sp. 092160098-2]|uniref:hypothetical protein n=1 Tax=Methylobacterium sp. 092160098-2 TaxID=3025129 RepID=UPI00238197F2|nr:hypothetical protein [Methylobacterium sp. 092160098-2]MDE4915050.1 hypothetical protein [Methylobacterium sp. 092160098-2]
MSDPRPRDYQQHRVYGFEQEVVEPIAHFLLSRDDIAALVDKLCRLTGAPVPEIRYRGSTDLACRAVVGGGTYRLEFADWGRTPPVVIHECAHLAQLVDPEGRRELQAGVHHGPVFVRLVIDLYATFMAVEVDVLERRATEHRVQFAPRRVVTSNFTSVVF